MSGSHLRWKFNKIKNEVDPEQPEHWLKDFQELRENVLVEMSTLGELSADYGKAIEQWDTYLDALPENFSRGRNGSYMYASLSKTHYKLLHDVCAEQLSELMFVAQDIDDEMKRMKS